LLPDPVIDGDETLNLNVWAPDSAPPGSLPVFVWIHGGSLVHGSNAVALYDGSKIAAAGVVVVSVNYRLGVEGFGQLPDAPANRGLLDQLLALQWVQANIDLFGGDKDRVTIAGESAGGYSVAALMASPLSKGLFHQAIMQSGPTAAASSDQASAVTGRLAAVLGVPRTAAALAGVDRDVLDDAQAEMLAGGSPLTPGPAFTFVVDSHSLPASPDEILANGASAATPLLLGTNRDEYRLWLDPAGPAVTQPALARAAASIGVPKAVVARYSQRPDNTPAEVLGRLASDQLLWLPAMRLAEARRSARAAATFMYQFNWASGDFGACHFLEVPFVFGTHDRPSAAPLTGEDPPDDLHRAMQTAWVSFIRRGDAGWPAWHADQPTMVFDAPESRVVNGPRAADFAAYCFD
jgi:para-nitrobenzyl esterase